MQVAHSFLTPAVKVKQGWKKASGALKASDTPAAEAGQAVSAAPAAAGAAAAGAAGKPMAAGSKAADSNGDGVEELEGEEPIAAVQRTGRGRYVLWALLAGVLYVAGVVLLGLGVDTLFTASLAVRGRRTGGGGGVVFPSWLGPPGPPGVSLLVVVVVVAVRACVPLCWGGGGRGASRELGAAGAQGLAGLASLASVMQASAGQCSLRRCSLLSTF